MYNFQTIYLPCTFEQMEQLQKFSSSLLVHQEGVQTQTLVLHAEDWWVADEK